MQLRSNHDVEIYFAFTTDFPALLRNEDTLDEEDWADIMRQRNRELRRRAIAVRVLLRNLLSALFKHSLSPPQWRFVRTSYGRLVVADGQPQVHFSISHTRGLSAIAISKIRPVGIDVEAWDSGVDEDALETGLSRREQKHLSRLDPHARLKSLLKLWTLKEAYSKMVGIGHSAHLPSVEFRADPARSDQYCGIEEHTRKICFENWFAENKHGNFCISVAAGTTE